MQKTAKIGYLIGILLSAVIVLFISLPGEKALLASGPMNTGHEALECRSCHLPAQGTMRQQIQANFKHLIGRRETEADFGYRPVTNETCIDCHERPNDRHPVSRFLEPRFDEARKAIKPHLCNSCHMEHNHKRVTINAAFCSNCHQNLKVKDDQISTSHEQLVAQNNWDSCLMCHDYHGNHVREVPKEMNRAVSSEKIREYFFGAPSPYSDKKQFSVKRKV